MPIFPYYAPWKQYVFQGVQKAVRVIAEKEEESYWLIKTDRNNNSKREISILPQKWIISEKNK